MEYRKGRPRHASWTPPDDPGEEEAKPPDAEPWPTDRVQVGFQAILLEEAGYTVTEAILYYAAEKLRLRIAGPPDGRPSVLKEHGSIEG